MKAFSELTEQEILALAISSEDDDAHTYSAFANTLMERFPASAKVFIEMAEEEHEHRRRLTEIYRSKFGDFIPLIRRSDVMGFVRHQPAWLMKQMPTWMRCAPHAEVIEAENARFYRQAAERAGDAGVKKLLTELAEAEDGHSNLADRLGAEASDRRTPRSRRRRPSAGCSCCRSSSPVSSGLMDGSVSTLAPLFAAAFATHDTWQTFLVGSAASIGAGISMGLAEGLSDDGKLTGRGHPLIRGLAAGIMTAVGGLGHALPYLIPDFWTATLVATVIVFVELWAISWIRYRYMDTPFLRAAYQVAVGGFLVFLTGIFIGNA